MRKILVGLLSAGLLGMALAATPANTNISNQASADYIDSLNQPRTIFSNQVITVVQQVYSFTITPDGATAASPGQTYVALPSGYVYFRYTLTNTGNGSDTIALSTLQDAGDDFNLSGVTIYSADCQTWAQGSAITSVTLARDGAAGSPPPYEACVIVSGQIPSGTPDNDFANLNLVGNGGGGSSDTNNWARAISNDVAMNISKTATPNPVQPGGSITYRIQGGNNGSAGASGVSVGGMGTGILISDPIPDGLSVSSLPSTATAGAGTVQVVKSTDSGANWSVLIAGDLPLTGTATGSVRIGMFIGGTGAFFPNPATYDFRFVAGVPGTAAFGTTYTNTASLLYNDGTTDLTLPSTTNTDVAANYSVAVGPNGDPTASVSDLQSQGPVYSGQTISFTNTLRNTGNNSDSFTLAFSGQPLGWTCGLFNGSTPISSAVGPFTAGTDFSFRLECQIPANYTSASAIDLTVSATSVSQPSQSDTTLDRITSVLSGIAVDLATHGNTGDSNAANDNPAAQSTNPTTTVSFPIDVRNDGQSVDSFTLSASVSLGWSSTIYSDGDCDGSMDTPLPAPTLNTGLVAPAAVACFIAQVGVPAGAAPGSYGVAFSATSDTLSTIVDTITTSVSVNQLTTFSFSADQSGTTTTPGTITYTHNLYNGGNVPARVEIPAVTSVYLLPQPWVYEYSLDGTTWVSDFVGASFIPLAAGATQALYVRVQVPGGQPINRSEAMVITANATYPGPDNDFGTAGDNGLASDSVTDTTTVVSGDLTLTKSAVSYVGNAEVTERSATGAQAYPGDRIVYTVIARNLGTTDLKELKIQDPLPGFTNFFSVSATIISGFTGGTVVYSTDGTSWSTTAPASLSAGQRIYVGVDTNGDTNITAADLMAPGSRIDITFKVVVQ